MHLVKSYYSLITSVAILCACAALAIFGGTDIPALAGDGQTDDTAAIQTRLDSGMACVYLPPPKDHYLISKTLRIGSGQEKLVAENNTFIGAWENTEPARVP